MIWITAGLWASLWSDNPVSGKVIISLVLAISVYALWQGWRGLQGLENDEKWVTHTEEKLIEQAFPAEQSDASESLDLTSLLEAEGVQSLIHHRIEVLRELLARRVKVSVQQLQMLSRASLDRRTPLKVPARAANTAMMLGIIGTFVGLASMVQEIQFALPAAGGKAIESWMDGFDNVAAVMAGIKTAFSTSLVGMTAALGLTWLAHRLEDRERTLLFHLEHFTVVHLLPRLRPELEGGALLEDLTRRMEDAYDSLEEASERNAIFLDKLSGIHEAYLGLVGQLRELGRSEASQDFDQLMEDVAKTNQAVLKVVDILPKTVDAIERGQRRFQQNLNPFHQILVGFSRLWSAQGPFGLPGAVLILILGFIAVFISWSLLR